MKLVGHRTNVIALLMLLLPSASVHGETPHDASIDGCTWRALIASYRNVKRTIDDLEPMSGRTPVYYVGRLGQDPLTIEQRQDLYELARKADRWRDFWFITLHWHRGDRYEATVYFKPDREEGKVRQGVAVRLHPMMRNFRSDPPDPYLLRRFLKEYVQVGEEPPEKFQPRPQNLPFPAPAHITNKELVELMDAVYSGPKEGAQSKQNPNPFRQAKPVRQPVRWSTLSGSILSLTRKGEIIEVEIGVREHGLSGIGKTLECKKEDGEWVITEGGIWVN